MNKLLNSRILQNIAGPSVIAMFFIGDRLLKTAAIARGQGISTPILGNWLQFRYVPNTGVAFSLTFGGEWLTIILSLIILCLLITIFYLKLKKSASNLTLLLLTFILIGAISNILDRYLYGAVVDYFDLKYFTIFNLADTMISIGVIALIWRNWRQ